MSPPQRSVPRACSRASASSAAARPAAAIIAISTMPRSQPRAARFSGGTAGGQDFSARAMGRRMRTSIAVLVLVLAVARAAPAGDATGAFAPYEDLLEVLADLTWHLKDDAYRFPPPKDPTGHDLYQLALHRLENWEKRYPGRLRGASRCLRGGRGAPRGRPRRGRRARRAAREARGVEQGGDALRRHAVGAGGARRGGAPGGDGRAPRGRAPPRRRGRHHRRRARAPLPHPEARRLEGAPGPHPPPRRLLRRARTRLCQ